MPKNNTCQDCDYFESAPETGSAGHCHRFPPVIPSTVTYSIFPQVKPDDWCGEWKATIPAANN